MSNMNVAHKENHYASSHIEEFYPLCARNDLNELEQQVARYIGGLKEAIQDKLEMNMV